MNELAPEAVKARLRTLRRWHRQSPTVRRTYEFADFLTAVAFVGRVARAAEKACHHPDIEIRSGKVTLTLSTHDAGGLTERDFALAARCDVLADLVTSRGGGGTPER